MIIFSGSQVVETLFLAPTETKGARVSVKADAGKIIVPWDYSLDVEQNHGAAFQSFLDTKSWIGEWVAGATATGFIFVRVR